MSTEYKGSPKDIILQISDTSHFLAFREVISNHILPYLSLDYLVVLEIQPYKQTHRVVVESHQKVMGNPPLRNHDNLQYLFDSLKDYESSTSISPLIISLEELSQVVSRALIEELVQSQITHFLYTPLEIANDFNIEFLGFAKTTQFDETITAARFAKIEVPLKNKLQQLLSLQHHDTHWLLLQLNKALNKVVELEEIIECLNIYVQPILSYDIVTWDNVTHNGHSYSTYTIEKSGTKSSPYVSDLTRLGLNYESPFYQKVIQSREPTIFKLDQVTQLYDPFLIIDFLHDKDISQLITCTPRLNDEPSGVLTFLYRESYEITNEELNLVNHICEMIAQVMGRLYAENLLSIRLAEKNVLQNIFRKVNVSRDSEEILRKILEYLESYLHFSSSTITIVNPDHKTYRIYSHKFDPAKEFPQSVEPYITGDVPVHPLYVAALQTEMPQIVYVEEVERQIGEIDIIKVLKESQMLAYISCPLRINGKTIGILFLNYFESATINELQLHTLNLIAEYLSLYMQDVLLSKMTIELNTFAHTFSESVIQENVQAAMRLVEKNLQNILQFDSFYATLNNAQGYLYYTSGLLPHLRESELVKKIGETSDNNSQYLLIEKAQGHATFIHPITEIYLFDYRALSKKLITHFPLLQLEKEAGLSYGLVIPLRLDKTTYGELIISSFKELEPSDKDYYVLRVLTDQVTQGLGNVSLYEELASRQRNKDMELSLNQDLYYSDNWEDNFYFLGKHIKDLIEFSWGIFAFKDEQNDRYYFGICESLTTDKIHILTIPQWAKELGILEKDLYKALIDLIQLTQDKTFYNHTDFKELTTTNNNHDIFEKNWDTRSLMKLVMPVNNRGKLYIYLGSPDDWGFDQKHISSLKQWEKSIGIIFSKHLAYSELKQNNLSKSLQLGLIDILKEKDDHDWSNRYTAITQVLRKYLTFDIAVYQLNISSQDKLISYVIIPVDKTEHQVLNTFQITEILQIEKEDLIQVFEQPPNERAYLFQGPEMESTIENNPFFRQMYHIWGVRSFIYFPVYTQGTHIMDLILASKDAYQMGRSEHQLIIKIEPTLHLLIKNMLSYDEIQELHQQKKRESFYLQEEIHTQHNFEEIIGNSDAMKKVFNLLATVAPLDTTVLLLGETGTGKELFARALHNLSPRKEKPLIKVNCASLPPTLIESELFGHEADAFTGARKQRIGKFELANGGSIFLDEIGELPLDLQSKLLRVIQDQEIERIGGNETININVRIIAATNRNLVEAVQEGNFRSDLYFRLNVFPIELPPLRNRVEDIPLLAQHFVQKIAPRVGKKIKGISETSLEKMARYSWPGNVRELEHFIERSIILCNDNILTVHLPSESELEVVLNDSPIKTLEETQKEAILLALKETNGRVRGKGGAAELLDIHPSTLDSRIKKLGIEFQVQEEK